MASSVVCSQKTNADATRSTYVCMNDESSHITCNVYGARGRDLQGLCSKVSSGKFCGLSGGGMNENLERRRSLNEHRLIFLWPRYMKKQKYEVNNSQGYTADVGIISAFHFARYVSAGIVQRG